MLCLISRQLEGIDGGEIEKKTDQKSLWHIRPPTDSRVGSACKKRQGFHLCQQTLREILSDWLKNKDMTTYCASQWKCLNPEKSMRNAS